MVAGSSSTIGMGVYVVYRIDRGTASATLYRNNWETGGGGCVSADLTRKLRELMEEVRYLAVGASRAMAVAEPVLRPPAPPFRAYRATARAPRVVRAPAGWVARARARRPLRRN